MIAYRGFVVLGAGATIVLVPFLLFVATGWPGAANPCIFAVPDSCFCEQFDAAAVLQHAGGVRQPVNTWFNLYALITASIIATWVYRDRKRARPRNLMQSTTVMPDLYIFVVMFLGLGSMWYHASLTTWGGIVDGASMYVYAAFLTFYSLRRIWNSALLFWIGYPATVLVFTGLHHFVPSVILIAALVVAYAAVEVAIWIRTGTLLQGTRTAIALWLGGIAAMAAATVFWALSQTGGPLCAPASWLQPHGLFWHPLAGVAAVLLYFYWRAADDEAVTRRAG